MRRSIQIEIERLVFVGTPVGSVQDFGNGLCAELEGILGDQSLAGNIEFIDHDFLVGQVFLPASGGTNGGVFGRALARALTGRQRDD